LLILVNDLDDNLKCRRLLESILRDCGFEVTSSGDPAEAMREFSKLRFDAAVIDYRMPLVSGPEVARKIKAIRPDVPVVMLPAARFFRIWNYFGLMFILDRVLRWMIFCLLYVHLPVRGLLSGAKPPQPSSLSRRDHRSHGKVYKRHEVQDV